MAEPERDEGFEQLVAYIRDERGFDFTGYKRPSLRRRIEKRMQEVDIGSFAEYRAYLENHQDEFVSLFNTILINVTSFFRDAAAWEYVAAEIVPRILAAKDDLPIRVWSTGCASGEEAYTIAMVLLEALGEEAFKQRVKIYATDVDEDALSQGRHGIYPEKAVEPVLPELLEKYFERDNSNYVFRPNLRRSVIFGSHDLLQDPPISRVDLLVSRNTLMYFNAEAQDHILRQFHFALNPNGVLFLGRSELIANRSELFTPIDLRRRVFAPVQRTVPPIKLPVREPPVEENELARLASESLIRDAGFEAAPVAQLVVDHEGKLALANLQARMLFSLTQKDIGKPIQDLEVSYRPVELRSRIEQAYNDKHTISLRDIEWSVGETELRYVDIQVVPLISTTGQALGCAVTFTDVTRYQRLQQALTESKRDAETAYEELQSTVEELETTNEELQSTNEELETTNEELHSTNEELETMNEELQSTNEELSTINDELQMRTDELNTTNAFLESILGSLGSAVIVLDRKFEVERWNKQARELWGLIEDEARGTHFLNLDIGLPVDELRGPIRDVANGRSDDGVVQVAAINRRGRPVEVRVQLSPLTRGNEVDGVILVMEADAAATKA
ncbi:MAG TPA: CheR family methyltransferase [Gaiellaceae bacterium]